MCFLSMRVHTINEHARMFLSEYCPGPSPCGHPKIWQKPGWVHHFVHIGFFVVGQAEVVCKVVGVLAGVQFLS